MHPLPLRSCIVTNPPHFFAVVLQLNLDHRKLMIPRSFIRDYEKFLSGSIIMKLPDCKKWNVGLTKASSGAVWMENGWYEFAEHYRLELGSFLVFRYDGDSTFYTTIFNKNGLEIKYVTTIQDSQPDFQEAEHISPQPNKNKSSFSSHMHNMRMEDSFSPKLEPPKQKGAGSSVRVMPSGKKRVSKEEDKKSEQAAEKPGFEAVMKQSNVGGRLDMITPKSIVGKYLAEEIGMIRVQTTNHTAWSLVYRWSLDQPNCVYISTGWDRFAKDNHFQQGDIGFFRFIQQDHFYFTKLQQQPQTSPLTTISSAKPCFQIPSHLKLHNNVLYIPNGFSKHLSPEMDMVKLQVGNKQWEVKLKQYNNRFRFSAGWADFYKDNRLEDASSCLFEMVHKKKKSCIFKVTVFNDISSTSEED